MRKISQRKRHAFTLMEVLLVAGILALLAAFALPRLVQQSEDAKKKLATAAVEANGSIAKALDSYANDMGKYPETDEGLQVLFMKKGQSKDERFNGPYMNGSYEKNCRDPWTNHYEYRSPGEFNEDGYDLWSRGKDGEDDGGKEGSDDVKNWSEK